MKVLAACFSGVLLLSACGAEDGPEDAVLGMLDALKDGDGARAVACMSPDALAEMGSLLETLKTDPEAASAQLALMGIRVDAAEWSEMTPAGFAEAVFSSPMFTGIMASVEVSLGEATIDGDHAMVEVTTTIGGETDTSSIELRLENGAWSIMGTPITAIVNR
jgi:hypothetical protein